jgi:tetratricopeptide (TPR) repeat protein
MQESVALYESFLPRSETVLGSDQLDHLVHMNNLAQAYYTAGQLNKAKALFIEVLNRRRRSLGDDHSHTFATINQLAIVYDVLGQFANAESLLSLRLDVSLRKNPADSLPVAAARAQLGMSLLLQGKFAEAEPLLRESLDVRKQKLADNWATFNNMSMLGGSLLGQSKYAEAEPLLLAGYGGLKVRERNTPMLPRASEALDRLVQLYDQWGKGDQAQDWRAERERQFGGYVHDWLVLSGPVAFAGTDGAIALDQQQLPGEATLRPREGDEITVGLQQITWKKHRTDHFFIDLRNLLAVEIDLGLIIAANM